MSRRGENITKRKDGRWEARYIKGYENGKAVYGFLYGKSYSEAKSKKIKALSQITENKQNVSFDTFNALIDSFLLQKRYSVKESTFSHYNNLINTHIRPKLGSKKITDISAQTIEEFASEELKTGKLKSKDGLSPKTVKDILSIVKAILKYGVANNIIQRSVISFALPKALKKEIEVLSNHDRECLERYTICADNLHFGIYLCLYTGLRIGELCALQWSDIDFVNSCIYVKRTIMRITLVDGEYDKKTKIIIDAPKTEKSKRTIPIPQELSFLLKSRRGSSTIESYYFLTDSSKYIEPRNYYEKYKSILNECGLTQYTFHALRHTFATRCVEKGFDAKVLSEILGHTDVKITLDRYVHPSLDRKRNCMELLYKS